MSAKGERTRTHGRVCPSFDVYLMALVHINLMDGKEGIYHVLSDNGI